MIVVRLQGGLGNQLFQYAFARFLARHHDTSLWLDTSYFRPESQRSRSLEVHHLMIRCDNRSQLTEYLDGGGAPGAHSLRRLEDDGLSLDDVIPYGPDLFLHGEWSSHNAYLFAAQAQASLRQELEPASLPATLGFRVARDYINAAEQPVCVQVRRGDYKKLTHIFRLLDSDYYRRAMDVVQSSISEPSFFVFSDDIDDTMASLDFSHPVTFIRTESPVESLMLSSMCRHFIAANSTFSWWSSYLGEEPGSVVLVPREYYANEIQLLHEGGGDYFPSHWRMV